MCAARVRVTRVDLSAGRILWPAARVLDLLFDASRTLVLRDGTVATCALRGRVTLVGLSAGRRR